MIQLPPPTMLLLCEGNRHIVRFPLDGISAPLDGAKTSFGWFEARACATGTVNRCRIMRGRVTVFAGTAGMAADGKHYDARLDGIHVAEGQLVCLSLSWEEL